MRAGRGVVEPPCPAEQPASPGPCSSPGQDRLGVGRGGEKGTEGSRVAKNTAHVYKIWSSTALSSADELCDLRQVA